MTTTNRWNLAGFTLIEIIVTLSIMAVIFSIGANGFNRMNSKSNLKGASETLASDLRSATSSAANSEQFQLQNPTGWGIYLDPPTSSYTIFADLNGNGAYDNNEKFKTVVLNKNIILGAIYFNSSGWSYGAVYFSSPGLTSSFSSTTITTGTGDLEIQVHDNVTGDTQSVWVNFLGAVTL